MKITGAAFLILLFAVAIVLILRTQEIKHVQDDVARMAPRLMEEGVEGRTMRHLDARARIHELESLCDSPSLIGSAVPRLREVAGEAAAWAAGSPSPSRELTAAVGLRIAADTLREYAVRPSDRHLRNARTELSNARSALEGLEPPAATSTDALRERIKNIDYAHREQLQELEEAY